MKTKRQTTLELQLRRNRRQASLILFLTVILSVLGIGLGLYVLLFVDMDGISDEIVGTVMLAPLVAMILQRYKRALARTHYAEVTAAQFPLIHSQVVDTAAQLQIKKLPPHFCDARRRS